MTIWDELDAQLQQLARADLLRAPLTVESPCGPTVHIAGRQVVCLCSNDYLSLAAHEQVKAAAREAIDAWGVGAGGSRLVSGTTTLHVELERRLARFKRTASAIVTPTGWIANRTAIHALAGKGDLILCDKLNHASILDAAASSGAAVRAYAHCDMRRLRKLLDRLRPRRRRCLIVTDSLFSMDGDIAPLEELVQIKESFNAVLLVDEAHATGVLGATGRGAAELAGVEDRIDAVVGTLSKAIGGLGGFVAGPEMLIETVRNTARSFIYTTALPPALCAAAIKSLEIIDNQPHRRVRLLQLAARLREGLCLSGVIPPAPAAAATTQIIPIIVGDSSAAVQLSRRLLDEGFLVPAIRPPTVRKGASRLRVSLSAGHSDKQVDSFVETVTREMARIVRT